jgi:Na+-translocating ferredoxin:NAD+ oxidoreductase subunit B
MKGGNKMDIKEKIYRDLQMHLDKQPVGYPATKSGAEIRILKRLFTPEEARLAMYLSYKPETAIQVYELAKGMEMSLRDIENMLDRMMRKGAIGHVEKEGTDYFHTIPFIVGMFEYQLYNLTPEFLADVQKFTTDKAFGLEFLNSEVPQMRTIPVGKSIPVNHYVTTYDHLTDIINGTDGPIVMHECICRKVAGMKGDPCKKTSRLETCTALGDMAKNSIRMGKGRVVSREEALDLAGQNESDGLVLQPSNTQKVDFVCACCGCCCGMLRVHKMLPKPVDFWSSDYYASVNSENCTSCGVCAERCQVNALSLDDCLGIPTINLDRCIGCGNCISSCPSAAISLLQKDKNVVPPMDTQGLYDTIMANKKGKLGKIKLAARLILKR